MKISSIELIIEFIVYFALFVCIFMSFFKVGFYTTFAIVLIFIELKMTKYNNFKQKKNR